MKKVFKTKVAVVTLMVAMSLSLMSFRTSSNADNYYGAATSSGKITGKPGTTQGFLWVSVRVAVAVTEAVTEATCPTWYEVGVALLLLLQKGPSVQTVGIKSGGHLGLNPLHPNQDLVKKIMTQKMKSLG